MSDGSPAPAALVRHRQALLSQFRGGGGSPVTATWRDDRRPAERDDIALMAHEADAIIAETRRSQAAWQARRARTQGVSNASDTRKPPVATPARTRAQRSAAALQSARAALYTSRKESAFRERQRISNARLRHML